MTVLEVEQRECKEYEVIMEESVKDYCSDEDKNCSPAEREASADCVKTRKRARYNTKDINHIALASLRHHTGLRETAEIATAAWIDAGLITQFDIALVIDHNKVRRAQEKIMKKLDAKFEVELQQNGISCIFFDGRRDETKVMLKAEKNVKMYSGLVKEEHYRVCMEPGRRYL